VLPQSRLRNQAGACLSDIRQWSAPYRKSYPPGCGRRDRGRRKIELTIEFPYATAPTAQGALEPKLLAALKTV
jgi:hypothetical protein